MDLLKEQLAELGEITLEVRVHPGASQTRFKQRIDDTTIKLDIAAPPEKGKANKELIRFLSKELNVSKHHVEILAGETSRSKIVKVTR